MSTTEDLLALIDRLEALLERSGLAELEVQAGDLEIVLRKPGASGTGGALGVAPSAREVQEGGAALDPPPAGSVQPGSAQAGAARGGASQAGSTQPRASRAGSSRSGSSYAEPTAAATAAATAATTHAETGAATHAVLAPLSGIYYAAPSPGAAPYVAVGMEIMAGQVIGLIEAMKLFNEIKSDAAGRVVRLRATDGALVRAKQPLIEIEPTI